MIPNKVQGANSGSGAQGKRRYTAGFPLRKVIRRPEVPQLRASYREPLPLLLNLAVHADSLIVRISKG